MIVAVNDIAISVDLIPGSKLLDTCDASSTAHKGPQFSDHLERLIVAGCAVEDLPIYFSMPPFSL